MGIRETLSTAVFLSLIPISGCSTPDLNCTFIDQATAAKATSSISIILAPTSSFVDFDDTFKRAFANVKTQVAKSGTEVSAVSGDGSPRLLARRLVEIPEGSSEREAEKYAGNASVSITRAAKCLTTVEPLGIETSPESDLLSAFGESVRTFPEEISGPENHIYLIGNGLITAGQWSFVENGGIPQPENLSQVIDEIVSSGLMPDLRGATVSIFGLGQVNPKSENKPLTNATHVALRNFWIALIENANGVVGTIEDSLLSSTPSGRTIEVSAVESLPAPCLESAILDAKTGFSFKEDSSDFVDLVKAQSVAKDIVDSTLASACVKQVTVTGFVASGTSKDDFQIGDGDWLAKERAIAFANLLNASGLPKGITLVTVGGGKGPFSDWGPGGEFIESKGARNRFAVVSFD